MRCDTIAQGIIAAAKEVKLSIPLVVRLEGMLCFLLLLFLLSFYCLPPLLEGTNVALGKELLQKSGLPIITADNLDDAAQKAVASISKH